MATGTLSPSPYLTLLDNSGAPISGGKIYTYESGTSTALATYSDAAMTTANANPTIADSAGRIASMYLIPGEAYKFVVKDASDVTIETVDPVGTVPASTIDLDITGTAGEAISAGECCYLSQGDGARTAGRWYLADGSTNYMSSTARQIAFAVADVASGDSGTFRMLGRVTGLSGLTAGTVYYASDTAGALAATAGTNERAVGVADSTTSLTISFWIVGAASGSAAGIISLGAQTLGTGTKTVEGLAVSGTSTTFGSAPTYKQGTASAAGATVSGVVNAQFTAVGNVGTGEDDLMTYSLPANSLSANGKAVRVTAWGSGANNANPKTVKFYFGATSQAILPAFSGAAHTWRATATIVRSAASAQLCILQGFQDDASSGGGRMYALTPAADTTGAITIKFTGTVTDGGGGVNNNDVTQAAMVVEVVG